MDEPVRTAGRGGQRADALPAVYRLTRSLASVARSPTMIRRPFSVAVLAWAMTSLTCQPPVMSSPTQPTLARWWLSALLVPPSVTAASCAHDHPWSSVGQTNARVRRPAGSPSPASSAPRVHLSRRSDSVRRDGLRPSCPGGRTSIDGTATHRPATDPSWSCPAEACRRGPLVSTGSTWRTRLPPGPGRFAVAARQTAGGRRGGLARAGRPLGAFRGILHRHHTTEDDVLWPQLLALVDATGAAGRGARGHGGRARA